MEVEISRDYGMKKRCDCVHDWFLNPANSEDFFERIQLDPILASCLEYWLSNAFSKLHDPGCS